MPSIFAPQAPVTNDTGAAALGFQSAPNVLYDRTLVGNTTYTISTAGTTGGETLSITLRGPYSYSFTSSVAINWAGGVAPTPACSASTFDRIRFEVLQDGSLLGTPQALGAGITVPVHYLNVSGQNQNASAAPTAANDGSDSFLSIMVWLNLISAYENGGFAPLVSRWATSGLTDSNTDYVFGISYSGVLTMVYFPSNGGSVNSVASTVPLGSTLANASGLWVRVDLNAGVEIVNGTSPGTAIFYAALGGGSPNWTQLGASVNIPQTGIVHNGVNSAPIVFGDNHQSGWNTNTCHMYEAIIRNSTTVLANPNFQSQPATASGGSFIDTAATPNTINLNTDIV
jgi:hypothetical protein